MTPIRVGVIDVGSNSIKLLIVESADGIEIHQVLFTVEEIRIGEGMTGSPPIIDCTAIAEGTKAISRLHAVASEHSLQRLSLVATSAVRDAQNRDEFTTSIRNSIGMELKVLSGAEEASLIGKGIRQDPMLKSLKKFTLADLGGGSLECIQFNNQDTIASYSFNLGAVRLTSKYVQDRLNPIRSIEQRNIEKLVRETLVNSSIDPITDSAEAVLTGGSASILGKLISDSTGSKSVSLDAARSFRDQVCQLDFQNRVSALNIPYERADIFPAATIILCELLRFLSCDSLRFSLYNLRWGIAAALIDEYRSTEI